MSPDESAQHEPTTSIAVPPHPRLLSVLGDIEFQPWQCIAELVDNAFDDFLQDVGRDLQRDPPTVWVTLPSKGSTPRDGEVWVKDNGRGMTLPQLTNALRAGFTGNARYGHLGLFGVGFNIATARLGRVAVVRTARVEDPVWQVVTIDLREVESGNDFTLPVTTQVKTSAAEHGTEVQIRELKPEHHDTLTRQRSRIRENLGDVYSSLLSERQFRLVVDRELVKPRRPCVWSDERFVVRNRERIPAIIRIDERLKDRTACLNCGTWQDGSDDDGHCTACRSTDLRVEERRIHGWVGIQRYLHTKDFGVDFLRNGRKILLRDVSIFNWVDPDDPGSRGEPEYPIEVPAGAGRIVGEIHIDHVGVNYQKNAFEYDTPDWKRVVRTLRGEGPLLPKRAKDLGYPVNTSPLAQLVAGYRRNVPGLDYLIPGDGKTALHDKARQWAERFRKDDPTYQSDEEWYQAAWLHDNPPVPADPEPRPELEDILESKGLAAAIDSPPITGQASSAAPRVESEDERRARWRAAGTELPDLNGKFGLRGQGATIEVTAWLVYGQPITRPDGELVPVFVGASRGAEAEVFINGDHPIFREFGVDIRDLVVMEISDYLRQRSNLTRSLSGLFHSIKEECLPDHKVTGSHISENATRILATIRELMTPAVAGNSAGYWGLVSPEDQAETQRRFAQEGGTAPWEEDVLESGEWVDYAPGSALVRVVAARPEAFMDGRVFRVAHQTLTDAGARQATVDRIVDLMSDVAGLADRPLRRNPEELQRGRLSCRILEQDLASTGGEDE